MYSKEYIQSLIRERDDAVERGIVRLYNLQTADEQASDSTKRLNNVGFNASDARYGSYLARWVLNGGKLTGNHLNKARLICLRYSQQLTDLANKINLSV